MKLSIQRSTFILLFIVLSVIILTYGGTILKPMAFALIAVSIYLKPAQWFERRGANRFWSVSMAMVLGTLLLSLFGFLITNESIQVMGSLKSELDLKNSSETIANEINERVPVEWFRLTKEEVNTTVKNWMADVGVPFISNTFKSTGYILSNALLAMIYTFLILLYRGGIGEVIADLGSNAFSEKSRELVIRILKTGQQYIGGLGLLILFLSILYGLTFWLFGLDYPIVFALIAASLAVIPYVGTTLGASLPVIYAYLTYDNHFIALGLIGAIMFIQMLEGNLLTPKIVGGNMKLNPLASMLAVVVGNFIWGLAGMVLFLPLVAMVRIIFEETRGLKPLADLSGTTITSNNQDNE